MEPTSTAWKCRLRGFLLLLVVLGLLAACTQDQDSETPSAESRIAEQAITPTPSPSTTETAQPSDPPATQIRATLVPNTPSPLPGSTPEPTAIRATPVPNTPSPLPGSTPEPTATQRTKPSTPVPSADDAMTGPDTEEDSQVPISTPEAESEPVPLPSSPASPISLAMDISYITGTEVGAEAGFTVTLLSDGDADDVSLSLDIPFGLVLVSGDRTWTGDLQDQVPVTLGYLVHAIEIGDWGLEASAKWYFTPDSWYGDGDELCILLGENSHEAMTGQCPAQPSQATEIPELKPDP